jgi:choline dehydrogenase-like flavoprotein
MGDDINDSVVNAFGQTHDVKNLFVADASVMVSQGCGDSPALTIMSLALRTADYMISEFKKGNL